MARPRVPGIDHGTCNSALALMEDTGPRVIKPDGVDDVMPSAVYVDRRGRVLVGKPAYVAMMTRPGEGNGHIGYKARIGQDDRYEFAAARRVMTAPQLGSLVLGELLKAFREDTGGDARACVITVPAVFEQSAFEGTREAAKGAGLEHFTFIQEPIAAAIAYGFTSDDERAQWVIFDLGAGTLDISLVVVRKGQLIVPEAGNIGDRQLGGRKFDRELLDFVLGPRASETARWERYRKLCPQYEPLRKQFALEGFAESANQAAWGQLALAVERAKIELSRKNDAVVQVDGVLCQDERGRPVKVEVPVSRSAFEQLIAADVEKAALLCQNLLTRNRLAPRDVQRLILIGGPSKTPYIQRVLTARLGIKLDAGIDPMTAVAMGAAIFAATVELPAGLSAPGPAAAAGAARLELQYDRASALPTHTLIGKVEGAPAGAGTLSVEVRRSDGAWASGRVPVSAKGVFSLDLGLIDQGSPVQSRFTTTVFDGSGKALAQVDEPEVWYPPVAGRITPHLTNSLRIGLADNHTDVLLRQGMGLPAKERRSFHTNRALRRPARGEKADTLVIPVLQGVTHLLGAEDDNEDCCVQVGSLEVRGDQIPRDLPEDSEVEVTLACDESQNIRLVARVALWNEDFEMEFKRRGFGITPDKVTKRLEQVLVKLKGIVNLHKEYPQPQVARALEEFRRTNVVEETRKEAARARAGEGDSLDRSYRRTLELAGSVNSLYELQREARIRRHLAALRGRLSGQDGRDLDAIAAEFDKAVTAGDAAPLVRLEGGLDALDRRFRRQPISMLIWDWQAFVHHFGASGDGRFTVRGNDDQLAAFSELDKFLDEVIESDKEGRPLTDAQIDEARRLFARLDRAWTELPRWRAEVPEPSSSGGGEVRLRK